jgi:hypothetical protein
MKRYLNLPSWSSVLILSLLLTSDLFAEPISYSNCLTESSSFYKKLQNAGVLGMPLSQPDNPKPASFLFRLARAFRYEDKRGDRWQSPDETAKSYRGNCADKAIWLYARLRENGYENASLHIGRYAHDSRVLHAWVTLTEDSGKKLLLDPTNQKKPWPVEMFFGKGYKSLYAITGDNCVSF